MQQNRFWLGGVQGRGEVRKRSGEKGGYGGEGGKRQGGEGGGGERNKGRGKRRLAISILACFRRHCQQNTIPISKMPAECRRPCAACCGEVMMMMIVMYTMVIQGISRNVQCTGDK